MTRAPYNRDTIALIRKGATHEALGWDASFYERVCKDHGIELYRPKETTETGPFASHIISNPHCEYSADTHELIRGDQAVTMTVTTGSLFCIIARAPSGCFLAGPRIATLMGILSDSVSGRATLLRRLIKPLRIHLASERTSGYQLQDASSEPLRVSIVGKGKP